MRIWLGLLSLLFMVVLGIACGGPPQAGVGGACTKDTECNQEQKLTCLLTFKGGYCGIEGCTSNAGCPTGSACVSHTNGKKYCFQTCQESQDCTTNRTSANPTNCTINVIFVDGPTGNKVCEPTLNN